MVAERRTASHERRIASHERRTARAPRTPAVARRSTPSALGDRCSWLVARGLARGSVLGVLGARRSALGARRSALGARRSALGARAPSQLHASSNRDLPAGSLGLPPAGARGRSRAGRGGGPLRRARLRLAPPARPTLTSIFPPPVNGALPRQPRWLAARPRPADRVSGSGGLAAARVGPPLSLVVARRSAFGVRRSALRRSALGASALGASALGARRSALRRSAIGARRSGSVPAARLFEQRSPSWFLGAAARRGATA
jgi:hypothetical protein